LDLPSSLQKAKGKPLTAAFVKTISEPGKYHDGGGTGLYLRVQPNGTRFWIQRIVIRGKRRELGLGSYPSVPLVEAREKALENKRIAREGRDPSQERKKQQDIPTFEEAARAAHVELSPSWKNPKDRAAFLTTLETYIFPHFGSVPLPEVTSADVRKPILAARAKVPGVARKLVYRVSAVFRWGIAEGHCTGNPATTEALALPKMERNPTHRKALPYDQVSVCVEEVNASSAWIGTKLAFEFVVLTAMRSGEVRAAKWDEIELHGAKSPAEANRATWITPAERMKMKRPHRVPLSPRAIEILSEAERIRDGTGLVFPSVRGKQISDMTLSKLVKALGFEADVHGFRTSFRTWAQEQTDYPWEIAEAALAHKIGSSVEQAYARSDFFERRRQMMEDWATYLNEQSDKDIATA
jgi:integrase